jgi:molybdenum cofactor synthesis domain-containing protein
VGTAAIVTIGNELVSGDVENANASWLGRRLEQLGVAVRLVAAVPDELEVIAALVREQSVAVDAVVVTGGLGGTPDDITRESVAAAFGVGQHEVVEVAADLRARFRSDPDYAAAWARLPAGSRPLANPLGGAPGFVLANVYVLPGLPREMEAMFETIADELATGAPIRAWRRRYRTTESRIVGVLQATAERHPGVVVGSYPSFLSTGPEVEVVVKSSDPLELETAVAWIESALDAVAT